MVYILYIYTKDRIHVLTINRHGPQSPYYVSFFFTFIVFERACCPSRENRPVSRRYFEPFPESERSWVWMLLYPILIDGVVVGLFEV